MRENPYELASRAAKKFSELSKIASHDVLLVLGSGWTSAIRTLGESDLEVLFTDLPGFVRPRADGHTGILTSVKIGNIRALIQVGRLHC